MLPSRAQLSTRVRAPRFVLMATATGLLVLDGVIAMPWTGTVGVPPRMFLVHVLLVAVFFSSTLNQLRQLWGVATIGFVGLTLRDLYRPARLELVPPDFGPAVGIASTAIWVMSLWFLAQWSARRRRIDRIQAKQRDTFTGLYNREFFEFTLKDLLSQSRQRRDVNVGLLLVDIAVDVVGDESDRAVYERLFFDVGNYLAGADGNERRPYRAQESAYPCYLGYEGPGGQFVVLLSDLLDENALTRMRRDLQQSLDDLLSTETYLKPFGTRAVVVSAYTAQCGSRSELVGAAYQRLADEKRKAQTR